MQRSHCQGPPGWRDLGNAIAALVSSYFFEDGALQSRKYADYPADQGGYASVNRPLITGSRESLVFDVNRWQPLVITNAVSQNGIPVDAIQKFVGAQWKWVRPFALSRQDSNLPWIDPGPPPQLGGVGNQQVVDEVVDIIRRSGELTPDDGVLLDISPKSWGNSTLGKNDGTGYTMNPATGAPYSPNRVKRGDFTRVLAEYWADGPSSETPPGHWNVVANLATDSPSLVKKIGGTGPVVDDLEWDVKLYFAMNAAVHDAACAAWSLKRHYDGYRPIALIRYMAMLGQSTDPSGITYHPRGLPLVPGLIEEVTAASASFEQRHFTLPIGEIAIKAWPGQPADTTNNYSGAKWMLAVDWLPYQRANFVTPAFPGFISGHSTFSRAAAEVLTSFTGSAYFPGGLGKKSLPANAFLAFEKGPSEPVELQWATYYDAADQAGLSRIWGGIHVSVDDLTGRKVGSQVGKTVWSLAKGYFDGSILAVPVAITMIPANAFECETRFNTLRGMYYKLQHTKELGLPFEDEALGWFRATESEQVRLDSVVGLQRFFRVQTSVRPE